MYEMSDLIGVWRLTSFELTSTAGETTRPYGDAPDGRLVYTAGGAMSAHLGRGDRPPFAELGDSGAERALGALRTHFSYSGRYRIDGDQVLHDVDISISPDWVGTVKARRIAFDGGILVLTDEAPDRGAGVGVLRWRREE